MVIAMIKEKGRDNFLSSEEQYLFEELKLIQKMMFEAENIYCRWENLFIIAEGILLAATGQLLLKEEKNLYILAIIIGLFGIGISILFLIIQYGNYVYARARYDRWVNIEKLIQKPLKNKKGVFMAIIKYQTKWRNKYKRYGFLGYPTWYARICLPILFIAIWSLFTLFTIYLIYSPK